MPIDLENIELIRTAKARYCRLLDTKQFDEWESSFTSDASFVFHGLKGEVQYEFGSLADFLAAARGMFATTKTIHQTHNSEITFTSPTDANAIWSMEDWHIYAPEGDQPSKTMHGYGFYHETWRKIDSTWKMAHMALRRNIVSHGVHHT